MAYISVVTQENMDSIRKWLYKPRRDDTSLLAQFFYADEALNLVAAELDSFDGRKDPERCTSLVNHLRQCQDKVLNICNHIMDELIPDERADRSFRVKFPDDVMQDNLAGQLWFGAECLAAGSSIMNREAESGAMRPLAKALTRSLETVRRLLREASLRTQTPSELVHDRLIESLKVFDRLLAEFELNYVSAMVPVKTVSEYHLQQDVVVLFSETLQRAMSLELLTQDMIDQCDPALMFTIPRLAIVGGLLIYPEGPLSLDASPYQMSEMFRPFRTLLVKVRELLWTLTEAELATLEKMLCSSDDPATLSRHPSTQSDGEVSEEESTGSGCETVLGVGSGSVSSPDDTEGSQWTLPIIPCACTVQLSEDAPMTKQGLLNRSMPTPDITCDECLDRAHADNQVMDTSPAGESTAGTSEPAHQQTQSDIINSDDNVNYKQNVSLGDCGLRTIDEWKERGQSGEGSEDLHVHYSENWEALCSSGQLPDNCDKREPPATDSHSSSCSTCHSSFSTASDSSLTSETSSFNSECQDEEEVALALRAVQQAVKEEARAKFRSSEDLLHRLFVCVSGVADQLQTNFAGDLRHILKSVFLISASDTKMDQEDEVPDIPPEMCEDALLWGANSGVSGEVEAAPLWLPDEEAPSCMSCHAVFTVIRRRHHCRNCGKVFCARCSSNSVPLPRFGHMKPVRVCNCCFIYQVTPFSVDTIVTATAN